MKDKFKLLGKLPFTAEEKARWAQMMHQTWSYIADDIETALEGTKITKSLIVEVTCDANRLMSFGGMTREEDQFLSAIYNRPDFKRWASSTMNY